jgi:hypothetical protein
MLASEKSVGTSMHGGGQGEALESADVGIILVDCRPVTFGWQWLN